MTTATRYAAGYIESREVLVNGALPAGERDASKPKVTMYFAQVDSPLWYGELRPTTAMAVADGREYCERVGIHVPCFFGE